MTELAWDKNENTCKLPTVQEAVCVEKGTPSHTVSQRLFCHRKNALKAELQRSMCYRGRELWGF